MTRATLAIGAALAALITALAGPAAATELRSTVTSVVAKTQSTGTDVGPQACVYTTKAGVGGVSVRSRPTTSATRIGIMYEGQSAFGACGIVVGGRYTACGSPNGNIWAHIYWGSSHGYVARACVTVS